MDIVILKPIRNCQYNRFVVWKIFEYCTFGSDQKIDSIHWHTLIQDPFWNISVCNCLLNRNHLPPMLTRCSLPVGLDRYIDIPVCDSISFQYSYCVTCVTQTSLGSQNNFCHIFLRNHKGQFPDIWHRASEWKTV